MKKIRCPKCDEAILFDDKLYESGRLLVFECPSCRKEFKFRIKDKSDIDQANNSVGYLIVIENAFQLKQYLPLFPGKNVIGRFVKGTNANASIKTVDPSMDTTHCSVTVVQNKNGKWVFTLKDGPSGTGTFLQNHLMGVNEAARIEEGAIITIGASTLILKEGKFDENNVE